MTKDIHELVNKYGLIQLHRVMLTMLSNSDLLENLQKLYYGMINAESSVKSDIYCRTYVFTDMLEANGCIAKIEAMIDDDNIGKEDKIVCGDVLDVFNKIADLLASGVY